MRQLYNSVRQTIISPLTTYKTRHDPALVLFLEGEGEEAAFEIPDNKTAV